MGGIRCRYTGTRYQSLRDTHIEHVVALSEAHDSGLCAADAGTKRRFATGLLNLTLSDPAVNRRVDAEARSSRVRPTRRNSVTFGPTSSFRDLTNSEMLWATLRREL